MNYWVVKGRPDEYDFDAMLVPDEEQAWRTRRPLPKQLVEGDFVFIWASSPWCEFVCLAQFRSSIDDKDEDGNNRFPLKYISPRLTRPIGIEALRDDATLNRDGVPSFLKAGAAGTIFPLATQQGQRIRSLLVASNPSLSSSQSSGNLCASDVAEPPDRIPPRQNSCRLNRTKRAYPVASQARIGAATEPTNYAALYYSGRQPKSFGKTQLGTNRISIEATSKV